VCHVLTVAGKAGRAAISYQQTCAMEFSTRTSGGIDNDCFQGMLSRCEGNPIINTYVLAGSFRFVPMQVSGEGNKKVARRLARSHAVKQALQNKRRLEQQSSNNFRSTTVNNKVRKAGFDPAQQGIPALSPFALSASTLDPFQTLAVDSSRLQTFLGNCKIVRIVESILH